MKEDEFVRTVEALVALLKGGVSAAVIEETLVLVIHPVITIKEADIEISPGVVTNKDVTREFNVSIRIQGSSPDSWNRGWFTEVSRMLRELSEKGKDIGYCGDLSTRRGYLNDSSGRQVGRWTFGEVGKRIR